jgi:uncharacterized protein (TIGR02145 family)
MKKIILFLIFSSALNINAQQPGIGVTDLNGKKYKTIIIEDVDWMIENLNVSQFRNGDIIPEAKTAQQWMNAGNKGNPAWCYYDFDSKNESKYGKLYNWFAVNDSRGLAPEGWEIPSFFYWFNLPKECGGIKVEELPQLFYAKEFTNIFHSQKGGYISEYGLFLDRNKADYYLMSQNDGEQWFASFEEESTKDDLFNNPNVAFYNINNYFYTGPKAGASVRCIKE